MGMFQMKALNQIYGILSIDKTTLTE